MVWRAAAALAGLVLAVFAAAQEGGLRITTLAQVDLATVNHVPLQFRLLQVTVGAGEVASYHVTDGMVYQLAGAQTVGAGGNDVELTAGEGAAVGSDEPVTFATLGDAPSEFLLFVLAPAAEGDAAAAFASGRVVELFRGAVPLPGLVDGPYGFDLTRLDFEPHTPINDPHYRTGGALYYVLAGAGEFTADGITVRMPAGSVVYEPYGLVHQWANAHDDVTTVVLANISPVGAPAVAFDVPSDHGR
jgi:quercetin dioxygenase-like cupin family protein